ncbi:MAG TPA: GNAT family N-acetyltransferase [Methylomirabilota bacterium]|nr:GNAT family N-acetyltransferase [Methylomirabilota bacterium]
MTTVAIASLDESLETAYDEYLHTSDGGLLYYSLAYRRFLCDLLNCRAEYLVATSGSRVVGLLPLMALDGPYGTVWNSLPFFGSYGGILADDAQTAGQLARRYDDLTREAGVAAATVVTNPFVPPEANRFPADTVDERIGQFTSLEPFRDGSPDRYLREIESSARRNVRRARDAGVVVRIDNGALPWLEVAHRDSMVAVGGRAKPPRFFTLLESHFIAGKDYNVYVADVDGVTAGTLLVFYFNGTVEYFIPATLPRYRALQPMALVIVTAMQDAAAAGHHRWNWGGTWRQQSTLYRFKRKWNAVDRPYRYYTRINRRELLRCRPDELRAAYGEFYVVPFHLLTTS